MVLYSRRIHSDDLSGCGRNKELQHPACHRCIEHHQQITAYKRNLSVQVPLTAFRFKLFVHFRRAFLSRSAYGKFHSKHGYAEYYKEEQIYKDEKAAAVLTYHIRKLPYVSYSYCTACAEQYKAKTAAEFISPHSSSGLLIFLKCRIYASVFRTSL